MDESKNSSEKPPKKLSGSYSTGSPPIINFNYDALRDRTRQKVGAVKQKKPPKRLLALIIFILIIFGVGFGGGWLGAYSYNHSRNFVASSTEAKRQYISNQSQLIASIAKTVGQSVVSVDVTGQSSTPNFFGFLQRQQTQSSGTGFIVSSNGIIVTNRHVVPAGTTSVSVTLADGTHYDNVQVIGRTSDSSSQDIAFLKIGDLKGKTLVPVTLGDSSKMHVGDEVIAIGNALGQFQNTVTTGIISGFGRNVTAGDQSGLQNDENLTDLFQTDAAINEGNSGGPLVNINGEVIGINTAIASGAQNIGFAQPINELKALISSVLNSGQLKQPYLGVRYVSLTNDLAQEFNLKVNRGAYVVSGDSSPAVVPGSPADKAGLKSHDVITKLNNIAIDDKTSLTGAISRFKPGDNVTLTVVRGDKTITINATLGTAPTG
ncbi:MAG TPA: trypsin-like peptidase domain-containing protein [Candidatus Saccharimonadales bacterium]|nr:trypsin-like peptidase domain-containing protein [Candidatus Saccharimonadales bacterium]